MQNIAIILTLLLLPYWALIPAHVSEPLRGRMGVALVFAFTAIGHFVKTSQMTAMLPPWMPMRVPLIYATGVFEFLAAVAILIPLSVAPGWHNPLYFPAPDSAVQRLRRVSTS
jgi:hypothetical protein